MIFPNRQSLIMFHHFSIGIVMKKMGVLAIWMSGLISWFSYGVRSNPTSSPRHQPMNHGDFCELNSGITMDFWMDLFLRDCISGIL